MGNGINCRLYKGRRHGREEVLHGSRPADQEL